MKYTHQHQRCNQWWLSSGCWSHLAGSVEDQATQKADDVEYILKTNYDAMYFYLLPTYPYNFSHQSCNFAEHASGFTPY